MVQRARVHVEETSWVPQTLPRVLPPQIYVENTARHSQGHIASPLSIPIRSSEKILIVSTGNICKFKNTMGWGCWVTAGKVFALLACRWPRPFATSHRVPWALLVWPQIKALGKTAEWGICLAWGWPSFDLWHPDLAGYANTHTQAHPTPHTEQN